jgi:hypothetical protein
MFQHFLRVERMPFALLVFLGAVLLKYHTQLLA